MDEDTKPIGVFEVPLFNTQVAVFNNIDELQKYHTEILGEDHIDGLDGAAHGMCIVAKGHDGISWFYIFLNPGASIYTRIHECSHLADWVLDDCGVPIDVHNTEIRAYLMAALCKGLDQVMNGT